MHRRFPYLGLMEGIQSDDASSHSKSQSLFASRAFSQHRKVANHPPRDARINVQSEWPMTWKFSDDLGSMRLMRPELLLEIANVTSCQPSASIRAGVSRQLGASTKYEVLSTQTARSPKSFFSFEAFCNAKLRHGGA